MNLKLTKLIQNILMVLASILLFYGLIMSHVAENKRDHNPQDIDISIVRVERGVGKGNFETVDITYTIKNNTEDAISKMEFKTHVHDSKGYELGTLSYTFNDYFDPIRSHAQATFKTSLSSSDGYSDMFIELYNNGTQNILFDLEITDIDWKGGIHNSDSTYVKTNYRVQGAFSGDDNEFAEHAGNEQLTDENVKRQSESSSEEAFSEFEAGTYGDIETAEDAGEKEQGELSADSVFSNDYILPDSDRRYYTEDELTAYTDDQLRIARNEIYARCGRIFKDEALAEYFNSKNWYTPSIASDEFDESMLNAYEKANLELLRQIEERTDNSGSYEDGTYWYVTGRDSSGKIGVAEPRTAAFKNVVCDVDGLRFTQVLGDGTESNMHVTKYYGRLTQKISNSFSADAEVYSALQADGTTVYIDIFDEYGMLRLTDSKENEYYFIRNGGIDIKQILLN